MARKKGNKQVKAELGDSWIDAEQDSDGLAETTGIKTSQRHSQATPRSVRQPPVTPRDQRASAHEEQQFFMPSPYEYLPRPRQTTRRQEAPQAHVYRAPGPDFYGIFSTIVAHLLNVIARTFSYSIAPLAVILACFLVGWLGTGLVNVFVSSFHSALSPLCDVPGVSLLHLDYCSGPGVKRGGLASVHFDEVMTSQSRFEEILDKTADAVGLPADMKHSEASIRDLRILVKHSHLKSRHELELELTNFIETAGEATWDLQKFVSRVGWAADSIMSTTRWTKSVLEEIDQESKDQSGMIKYIGTNILGLSQSVKNTEKQLVDQYLKHMSAVENSINSLVADGMAVLRLLRSLEDRLEIIHDISSRDNKHAQVEKDELLLQLWTMLGGNRIKLSKLEAQGKVLAQVSHYRKSAFAQVSGTISELQQMNAELQGLRDRVSEGEMAVESQPLWVHIDSLERGVMRLEEHRSHQKGVDNEDRKAIMDRQRKFVGQETVQDRIPEIEAL